MTDMLVEDEIGNLKSVGLFGPPGVESYLAQFWPQEQSLFFGNFDVVKARDEFEGLVKLLEGLDVQVVDLKAGFCSGLSEPEISAELLVKKLLEKVEKADTKILEALLQKDAVKFGEAKAVALNLPLSYEPEIPMGNIYFARDQSNVLIDKCILGKMKFPIRQPEVGIIHKVLQNLRLHQFLCS